jgi:transposase-like protein
MKEQPSLFEVFQRFNTEEKCREHFKNIRWPNGVACLRCGSLKITEYETKDEGKLRHRFQCLDCKYNFTFTSGTIFHSSHLPLTKWFLAIYLICSAKKGVSAKQLQRQLEVTYKTAWYMAHRIRLAMQEDSDFCQKFSGTVEVDETYIGGKSAGKRGRGASSKVPVVAIKERTSGKIRMQALDNVSASNLASFIREHTQPGSEVHTDEFRSYWWLDASEFVHKSVNHTETYVRAGYIHTNGVENVWSLFKRGITGVFHKVSAKYLPLYLNEFSFRFNNRDEYNMMARVLGECF